MKPPVLVLFVYMSVFNSFEGMGGLRVTDIRRERIPLLWSTVGETALPKGFYSKMGNTKRYPCVCRRAKLPGRGVRSEKVREIGRS